MPAIVFDLDETLLDTSMLRSDRRPGRWRDLAQRLDEVVAYRHENSNVQAADLPACAKRLGYQVGVLTHSPRWYAERLLEAFDIAYDSLITGSDGYAPKPDPSSLRAITEELGVPVTDCIMVGDDEVDVGAAQAAGALNIGVAWSRRAPKTWRRRWPDVAIARPDRFGDVLNNAGPRFPCAEVMLAGDQPLWHWGSLLRLGNGVYGGGHYYTTTDSRHPTDPLSRLVIRAKNKPEAAEEVGELLAGLTQSPWRGADADLITSVPPKPGQDYDRFSAVRRVLSETTGTPERGDVLRQLFDDPDYKHVPADERHGRVRGRFQATPFNGQAVLLIDDVITSGGQAEECRRVLIEEGAGRVVILGLGVTQETLPRECPRCGGTLRLVTTGPYGPFVGCSNYARVGCRYTEEAPVL